jgi:hypothetical protein
MNSTTRSATFSLFALFIAVAKSIGGRMVIRHLILALRFRLPRIPHTYQDLLYLLVQASEHIYAHRRTRNKLPVDAIRCRLTVLRSCRNRPEQYRFDENTIHVGDFLRLGLWCSSSRADAQSDRWVSGVRRE